MQSTSRARLFMVTRVLCVVRVCSMVGLVVGLVPWRPEFGAEILGRTQPTVYDIIVALASAVAGTYALVDERISPALPGVAIAIALMPPLVTCGLCLAAGEGPWALGALLLFAANFLAIEIAAALVFVGFGMATLQVTEPLTVARFLRRFGPSLVALGAIALFMTHTLITIITERRLTRTIEATLSREMRMAAGASLSDVRYTRTSDTLSVVATVLTPQAFEPVQVQRLEDALRAAVDTPIALIVRSVLSQDVNRNGPVFVGEKERKRRAEAAAQTQFLTQVSHALTTQLQSVPGARLIDVRRDQEGEQPVVRAVVRTPTVIAPAQVARLEEAVQRTVAYLRNFDDAQWVPDIHEGGPSDAQQ